MKFRNGLAVGLIIMIPSIWVTQGMGLLTLSGEVVGVTIAMFTLVVNFYFRKKESV